MTARCITEQILLSISVVSDAFHAFRQAIGILIILGPAAHGRVACYLSCDRNSGRSARGLIRSGPRGLRQSRTRASVGNWELDPINLIRAYQCHRGRHCLEFEIGSFSRSHLLKYFAVHRSELQDDHTDTRVRRKVRNFVLQRDQSASVLGLIGYPQVVDTSTAVIIQIFTGPGQLRRSDWVN